MNKVGVIRVKGRVTALDNNRLALQSPDGKLQGLVIIETGELVIRHRRTDVVYRLKIEPMGALDNQPKM